VPLRPRLASPADHDLRSVLEMREAVQQWAATAPQKPGQERGERFDLALVLAEAIHEG
jgi:hypothetical protein